MRGAWRGVAAGWLALTAAGCASGPAGVEVNRLEGRWEWQSASGGIAGRTITPATEGYTMELRLSNGEAQLYRSGTLRGETGFRVGIGREGGSFPGKDVVLFDEPLLGAWQEMLLELPDESHLNLADGCCDGYAYQFARAGTAP